MSKLKKCKACGADIAKSAKTCPHCGAKVKKHTVLGIILIIFGVCAIAAAMGGGSDEPQKIGDTNTSRNESVESAGNENSQKDTTQTQSLFHVGDIVELNGVTVTLLSVDESSGNQFMTPEDGNVFVTFEFDIDNQTDSDIAVSSMLSFEAYFDDYSTGISLSAMVSSEKSQLDGNVAAGKKMTGVVGYEAPADWKTAEIRFTPDFWSGKDIIFEYSK